MQKVSIIVSENAPKCLNLLSLTNETIFSDFKTLCLLVKSDC